MFRVVEADLRVGFPPHAVPWLVVLENSSRQRIISIAAFGRPFRVTLLCSRKKSAGTTIGLTRAA